MDDPGPSAAYLASFPSTSNGPARPPSPPLGPSDILSPEEADPTEPDQALYALLNLPHTASDAEIRERYRSLVVTYHPDRQRTDEARAAAHRHFQALQRAYEVLSDVESRTVYDLYGEEGLRMRAADRDAAGAGVGTSGGRQGEVGRRNMTPTELREHFQAQYIATKAIEVDQLVKSRGDMTAVLDARAVFAPRSAFRNQALPQDPISRAGRLRVGQINMKHSFEVPVTFPALWSSASVGIESGRGGKGKGPGQNKTQVQIQGQMAARNGAGGGNVVGTVRHQFSPACWGEVGYSLMAPRIMTAKGAYSIDEHTYITTNLISPTFLAPPTIGLQLGRRLYAHTTGYISYKSGFFTLGPWGVSLPASLHRPDRSALAVGLTNSNPAGRGWTVETQAGVIANHITADYGIRWMGLTWKVGAAVGTDTGINVFVDAEGKVSGVSRVGMVVSAELGGGVSMRFKFSRLGQRISVPVMLSQNLNPYIVLGSTVLPFSAYAAAYHFIIMPRKKRRTATRAQDLRSEHADHIAQTRRQAAEAIDLMSRSVNQKVAQEREKGGLIILEAHYGLGSAFSDRGIRRSRPTPLTGSGDEGEEEGEGEKRVEEEEVVIDVTVPVQALVVDSKLSIPGGRGKNSILGFWDPCIGEPKKLRIRYLFRDQVHQITIDDEQAVRAPVKSHSLDSDA